MKNLPKEKRDKIIAIAGGTILGCVALWYVLINTQNNAISQRNENIERTQQSVENAARLVKQSRKVEDELQLVADRLQSLEDGMAQGDLYSWIIKTMNRFLINHRVEIPTYTPPGVTEVGMLPNFPYKAATYSIRGSAHFHDFGRFLADFENHFPCARIQNLDLEPLGTSTAKLEDAEKISFKLEIVTLVKPTAM